MTLSNEQAADSPDARSDRNSAENLLGLTFGRIGYHGVEVVWVDPKGPSNGTTEEGDWLTSIAGDGLSLHENLFYQMFASGRSVRIEYLRNGTLSSLTATRSGTYGTTYNYANEEGIRLTGTSDRAKADGLRKGDLIVSIDGQSVRARDLLARFLPQVERGDRVAIDRWRGEDPADKEDDASQMVWVSTR